MPDEKHIYGRPLTNDEKLAYLGPETIALLKTQLLTLCVLKLGGKVEFAVQEVDSTGAYVTEFAVDISRPKQFSVTVTKKN